MDIFDWYFKQIVTQSQMDWAFDRVQNAMHGISLDTDMLGILDGLDPQQHAPTPDKNVDVVGPGVAYDPEGQRIYVADTLSVVDCSQDEFGTNTDPPTAGWWRYISIFVRFERDLTEPALDGNNVVVYTKQLEDAEFFVRIGAEAATGPGAVPPPLMNDAVLLVDILVQQGFTAILNTDMDFSRREDWVRFAGATIGDRVYGTSKEATEDMLALIDAWGGALPFTFTSTWFGAAPVLGPAPPPTTIQTALDAIVFDLAQAGPGPSGSDLIGVTDSGPFPFVTPWAAANLQSVLMGIATDLDAHIGGAPPQHPASAITFTPYGFIGATDVQAALQEVVDDLANGALPTLGAALVGFLTTAWTAAGWPVGGVGDVYGALNNIVQTLMGQGAGTAGANYLGTEPIAGSPESIGASYVMAVLTAIYGHLNDRTERATDEVVTGGWDFDNGLVTPTRLRDVNNVLFRDNPLFKTIRGGSQAPFGTRGNLSSGLQIAGAHWACPWSGFNSISIGGTSNLNYITMTHDASTGKNRRIVISDDVTFSLVWLDTEDPTSFGTIPCAPLFPAGPTYAFVGMCSDERYIYIKVLNTGTGTYLVNAIDLTGAVRAGWPPLGTTLPGAGGSPLTPPNYNGNLIVAQLDGAEQYATTLASLNEWQNGGSNAMVSILNAATGAINASGDGDLPAVAGPTLPANCYPQGGLVSDGTNVWFTWKDSTATTGGFATAVIAAPGGGSGLAGLPYSIPSADSNQLIFDGAMIWYIEWTGDIWIYRVADQVVDLKAGAAAIGSAKFAVFDGLNVWMQDLEAAASSWDLHMIPVANVRAIGSGTQLVAAMVRLTAGMMQASEVGAVPANQIGKMCFDGDSVWMIMNTVGSTTLSGVVRRVPRAGLR